MAWTQVATDNFARSVVAPSASPGSVGSPAWVDNSPAGCFGINSGGLYGVTSDNVAFYHNCTLVRQSSEATLNQRVTLSWVCVTGSTSVARVEGVLRWNGTAGAGGNTGTFYLCQAQNSSSGSPAIVFGTVIGSTQTFTGLNTVTFPYTPVTGDSYVLDAFASGSSPTTLSATLTHIPVSGQTTVNTFSLTDNTSGLQVSGSCGTLVFAPSLGTPATTPTITNITTYSGTPSSTTCTMTGPSTGTVGVASSNFTVTPNFNGPASSTVVTMSDAANGGTFTPTTLTFGSGSTSPQTFTYTPASSGAKTISVTNNGGLANPANLTYTAGSSSMVVSPTTVTARQPAASILAASPSGGNLSRPTSGGVTVTVTGTGTSFSSLSQFTVTGGFGDQARSPTGIGGASLIGGSVNSGTQVATLIFDPGPFYIGNPWGTSGAPSWGTLTVTDTVSTLSQTIVVAPPITPPAVPPGSSGSTINILFVGDSISASDTNVSGGTQQAYGDLSNFTVQALQNAGYTVGWAANAAVDGSWTQQWLPTPYYSHNTSGDGSNQNVWIKYPQNSSGALDSSNFPFSNYYSNPTSTPGCYFNRAIGAANAARGGAVGTPNSTVGPNDFVHLMLYTNEITGNTAHAKGPLTVAQHKTFMAALVASFVALGYKVILTKPPYTWPYANTNSGLPWPPHNCSAVTNAAWIANGFTSYPNQYPHEIYQLMWEADQALIDGIHVFQGDTTAFEYSAANPYTFFQSALYGTTTAPGIHPQAGAPSLLYGQMWANGIAYATGALTGGGGSGSDGAIGTIIG